MLDEPFIQKYLEVCHVLFMVFKPSKNLTLKANNINLSAFQVTKNQLRKSHFDLNLPGDKDQRPQRRINPVKWPQIHPEVLK